MKSNRNFTRQNGAALLLAVWTVALLSLLAGAALQLARDTGNIAAASLERAQMEAAEEGAINVALLHLIDPGRNDGWSANGAPRPIQIGGQEFVVSIKDESGKVDFNTAPARLIESLLLTDGASSRAAADRTRTITSYRGDSASTTPQIDGLKQNYYQSADEIALIAQIPLDFFECLRPDVTVYTQLNGVDLASASSIVRAAASKIGLAAPLTGTATTAQESMRASWAGRVLSLEAHGAKQPADTGLRTIIRLSGDPQLPVLYGDWRIRFERHGAQIDCANR